MGVVSPDNRPCQAVTGPHLPRPDSMTVTPCPTATNPTEPLYAVGANHPPWTRPVSKRGRDSAQWLPNSQNLTPSSAANSRPIGQKSIGQPLGKWNRANRAPISIPTFLPLVSPFCPIAGQWANRGGLAAGLRASGRPEGNVFFARDARSQARLPRPTHLSQALGGDGSPTGFASSYLAKPAGRL